ncbi:hypothetical protein P261_02471 [Lachnospiraceae bacterium TWA4]|nr:hypothetical protein P261_02471 [Lachnospiraceae bacterium TWA4]
MERRYEIQNAYQLLGKEATLYDGMFCGCFYIEGQNQRMDWFIKHLYESKGFFTPPYESLQSLEKRLGDSYEVADVSHAESIVCFFARKGDRQ